MPAAVAATVRPAAAPGRAPLPRKVALKQKPAHLAANANFDDVNPDFLCGDAGCAQIGRVLIV